MEYAILNRQHLCSLLIPVLWDRHALYAVDQNYLVSDIFWALGLPEYLATPSRKGRTSFFLLVLYRAIQYIVILVYLLATSVFS